MGWFPIAIRRAWSSAGLFLAFGRALAGAGFAPGDGPDSGVHDPSAIVKCGRDYWIFSTGVGIKTLRSTNLVDWQPGPRVIRQIPGWVTNVVTNHRGHFWAPDIITISNRFLLYYSVSSWGKNRSAIGLVSNATLDPGDARFQWNDEGLVFESFSTNQFNAIDPCLVRDAGGRLWLAFGSFWSGIKMVELDPATGHRLAHDSPLFDLASYPAIEAPFIYRNDQYYYLFVNWDQCCRGVDSTYNLRVGRSKSITGPYMDKAGVNLRAGGGTLFMATQEPVIGPGHAGIFRENGRNWLSFHYYDGRRRGAATLGIRELKWAPSGWPELAPQ